MRLLVLAALIYICYRLLKSRLAFHTGMRQSGGSGAAGDIDDVMVKDPVCEVYFPKRNGFRLGQGETDLYFCSKECRDKYIAAHSNT